MTIRSKNKNSVLPFLKSASKKLFKRPLFYIFLLFISCILIVTTAKAQTDESIIKAVFFERFSRFIEWKKPSDSNEFKIVVVGSNTKMLNQLKKIYKSHTIKDKQVSIIHLEQVDELYQTDCDIIYISENMSKSLEQIVEYASKKSILTIADSKNFAKRGVIINFYLKDNSVQFKINQEAAKKSDLHISYHLLKMAEIVAGI